MLRELRVQDFALVEGLELEFEPGFTVLTGETGAGKSILIDAVEAVLGGKTAPEMVRSGADHALLEGVFAVEPGAPVAAYLEELGVAPDLDAEPGRATYVFSRELARGGRSRCRVNGRTVTREQLFGAGSYLVNLHGQHEHQTLLQAAKQLALLDAFAGDAALSGRAQVSRLYERYRSLVREQEAVGLGESQRVQRLDFLRYQVKEINEAALSPGEEEELLRERQLLLQAEKLNVQLERAHGALYGGEGGAGAADLLEAAQTALEELARIDPALDGLLEAVRSAACQASESARELAAYRERVDLDPERLDVLEERLDRISRLRRKYGAGVEAILAYAEQASAEMAKLERADERAGELLAAIATARQELETAADALSTLRRQAAGQLGEELSRLLPDLAMPKGRLSVRVALGEVGATGKDRAEFLFSANAGEEPRPLSRIASGGELSRVMLAVQTVLARADGTPTLIFDEIDAGISGRAGQKVAELLSRLGQECQVVCVTHLPQIASMAEHHVRVTKEAKAEESATGVSAGTLDRPGRVAELARLVGGVELTATTLRHAEEMLRLAEEERQAGSAS